MAGQARLIDRIDHLVLTVASLDATCDFYSRVLGFKRVDSPGEPTALTFGDCKINIHQAEHTFEPKALQPTPGAGDFCLVTTASLDEVLIGLAANGVTVEEGPVPRTGARGAMTSLYFRDPDGNLVEVSRYLQVQEEQRSMAQISFDLPTSLLNRLTAKAEAEQQDLSHLIRDALSAYLDASIHTLFQISTSSALVEGLYKGVITCGRLLQHGDFGLGTFENLDGEMVVLEGSAYRVRSTGEVSQAAPSDAAPFAVVTKFAAGAVEDVAAVTSYDEFKRTCDRYRRSDNLFYAFRGDGVFKFVRTRAVGPPGGHGRLLDAAKAQKESEFADVTGTLVGIYSPSFSAAFSVPGHHFHFLSSDRKRGGHVLDLRSDGLRLQVEELENFHLALPESEAFLKLDLSKDASAELEQAESR